MLQRPVESPDHQALVAIDAHPVQADQIRCRRGRPVVRCITERVSGVLALPRTGILLPGLDRRPCVSDSAALQPRDVRDFPRSVCRAMRRQDPGGPRIDSPPQLPEERSSRARVEPVQRLVEQQHVGPPDQRPCQQHAAPLAIGQAQESTSGESSRVRRRPAPNRPHGDRGHRCDRVECRCRRVRCRRPPGPRDPTRSAGTCPGAPGRDTRCGRVPRGAGRDDSRPSR